MTFFQVEIWSKRKLGFEPKKVDFLFPLEVLIALPSSILIFLAIMGLERSLRFRILYPMAVAVVGVLIPVLVISKNKKMTNELLKILLERPEEFLLSWRNWKKRNSVMPVRAIV